MNVLQSLFGTLPRQGLGAPQYTRRAVEATGLHTAEQARILELGCGTGAATRVLAGEYPFSVLAIDRDPASVDALRAAAAATPLRGAIDARTGDMRNLDLPEDGFDAVWSEGAAYILGFGAAAAVWRRHLRAGGYLVVSELTWLTETPAAAAREFWAQNYPQMASVDANVQTLDGQGYRVLEPIIVGADGCWDSYYGPMDARIADLRGATAGDDAAGTILDALQREIDLYRAHGDAYSYVFYLGQAPA